MLWSATTVIQAFAGMALMGMGFGALYPLGVALMLTYTPLTTDRSQAVATFAGGVASGAAPLILGVLSDGVGMHTAFVVVPVFAALGMAAGLAGARVVRGGARAAARPKRR